MSTIQDIEDHPTLFQVTMTVVRDAELDRPENYEREYVAPVQRLNHTLNDVLDVDGHPDRGPEEAMAMLKEAIDTFQEESATWL